MFIVRISKSWSWTLELLDQLTSRCIIHKGKIQQELQQESNNKNPTRIQQELLDQLTARCIIHKEKIQQELQQESNNKNPTTRIQQEFNKNYWTS